VVATRIANLGGHVVIICGFQSVREIVILAVIALAIQLHQANTIPEREYEDLKEFAKEFDGKVNGLLILTKDYEAREGEITCIPLWKWLLQKKENR
jgi:predicted AAA+ superfamily ATPase